MPVKVTETALEQGARSIATLLRLPPACRITAVLLSLIAHDHCDGLITVSLMLLNRDIDGRAKAMLLFEAAAPVLGAASTLLFEVQPAFTVLYLGFFAGFLLYISASDILPEAHSRAAQATALASIGLTS
jgi:ZIP family zinc transporter